MKLTGKLQGSDVLIARLRALDEKASEALEQATMDGARVPQQAANALAPGPHIQTETIEVSRKHAIVHIGPDREHWYYKFLETGALAHGISPAARQALKFEVDGEEVFAYGVSHPGMAAEPFLRPALDENKDRTVNATGKSLRRRLGI